METREWRITRKELYEHLWTKPLTTLAHELGVWYGELLSISNEYKIPRPPLGYWVKVKYGKKVRRTPLRPLPDREEIVREFHVWVPKPCDEEQRDQARALISSEKAADNRIVVPDAYATPIPWWPKLRNYWVELPNASIVQALVGEGDALFTVALNHACLIDGARLSRVTVHRYSHADLAALEALLIASPARRKLVMSDAVFSMDGDVADVAALHALCERHDALLLLEDAHGFGMLGPQGRGTLAAAGLTGAAASPRVLYMATLGKALGVAGAFVAGPERLVDWLLQKTRSYIFATAAPALLACALRSSLHLIEQGDERRAQLQRLIAQLREVLQPVLARSGWRLGHSDTSIQSLLIGGNAEALAVMEGVRDQGLWVPAIRPPTVAEGTARLRIALSAAHTEADVDRLVQALDRLAPASASKPAPTPATASLAGA